ncbi:MAG: tryptophan halogenase family protein [Pacificimonas sp.]
MTATPIRNIVIVGGGTAGWMAAAALSRFLGPDRRIMLVESDDIGTVGVGEATIPQLKRFNDGLGIDEADFVRATGGTFKLGIRFDGWTGPDSRYIHAFGKIGRQIGLTPFHHHWLRWRAVGGDRDIWHYSAAARAAGEGRFAPPCAPEAGKAASGMAYAWHFDAGLYAAYLRRFAEANGVTRIEGKITSTAQDTETGDVNAVTLDDGRSVGGDLLIDCSGFRGLLIEEALSAGYEDWSDHLPCDRALAVPSARMENLPPFTRAEAHAAGWQWRIPLQHRTGNGIVYSGAHMADAEAADILLSRLDTPALAAPRALRFQTGKRRVMWSKNVVALGLSAGFMEPLESTSIHLIQSGIARLLSLFPADRTCAAEAAEYNRQSNAEWLGIRDFLILHYHANDREEPFWQERRAAPIPDSLAARIDLFRSSGRLFREGEELFTPEGWLQLLVGQGIVPERWHPLADGLSSEQLGELMTLAARQVDAEVSRLPTHDEFIAAHCRSDMPESAA